MNMLASTGTNTSPPVLQVQNVSKEYKLYATPRQRMRALLTGRALHRSHWALKDVSLLLPRGQCMGVIGDNGAGKSSLLKLLAGTMQPSTGRVLRQGRVTAILELGAGFHPDFTGRENLYFAGSLIGIDAAQMQQLEAEIIDFAELQQAIDRPVKTYSSGMVVRLAFALVTAVPPQVLIVDEALAVGDQNFQKKCIDRIASFRDAGCSILFCSHSLYHVRQLCDVALWLDQGQIRAQGPTQEVIAQYEQHVRAREQAQQPALAQAANADAAPAAVDAVTNPPPAPLQASTTAQLLAVELPDVAASADDGQQPGRLQSPHLRVRLQAVAPEGECPSFGIMLEQVDGPGITSVATHHEGVQPRQQADGSWAISLCFTNLPLHTGAYKLSAYLFDSAGLVVYDEWKDHARFAHVLPDCLPGLVRLPHEWS